MTREFTIIEDVQPMFNKKIQELNKKARKLGVKEIECEVVSERIEVGVKYLDVKVDFEVIKMSGYKPVAVIEHTYSDANIVNKIDFSVEIPEKYFTIKSVCEHCNSNRRRKTTVLLQDEQGNLVQVGKSCLKDFVGRDFNSTIAFYSAIECLQDFEDMLPTECEVHVHKYLDVKKVLQMGIAVMEKEGYVNKQTSLELGESQTGQKAWTFCEDVFTGRKIVSKHAQHYLEVYRQDVPEEVEQIIDWVNTSNNDSEYMTNVKTIINAGVVKGAHSNILVSIIPSYRRFKEKQHEQAKKQELNQANLTNEWFGEVGKRLDLELECIGCVSTEGFYGITYINKFLDNEGRLFVWFTGTNSFELGEKVKLKGTIKEHSEFREQKQTILTRCKVTK